MFLQYIDFDLSVTQQEFEDYENSLNEYFQFPFKPEILETKDQIELALTEMRQKQMAEEQKII